MQHYILFDHILFLLKMLQSLMQIQFFLFLTFRLAIPIIFCSEIPTLKNLSLNIFPKIFVLVELERSASKTTIFLFFSPSFASISPITLSCCFFHYMAPPSNSFNPLKYSSSFGAFPMPYILIFHKRYSLTFYSFCNYYICFIF